MNAGTYRPLYFRLVAMVLALVALVAVSAVGAEIHQSVALTQVSQIGGITAGLDLRGGRVVAGQGASVVLFEAPAAGRAEPVGAVVLAGVVQGVSVAGRYAYVAAGDAGLQVVDIVNLAEPRLVGSLMDPAAQAWAVFGGADQVVLAERTDIGDRLRVLGMADPTAPQVLGAYEPLDGIIEGLAVEGSTVYMVNGELLWIVDLSDPAAPRELGTYTALTEPIGVVVSGDRAYVTDLRFSAVDSRYIYTVRILGVADPSAPVALGAYEVPGTVRGLLVDDDTLYVARADGLEVVDIRDPARPASLGTRAMPGGVVTLDVEGAQVVAAPGAGGLAWLDAANPAEIREVATHVVPVAAHDVAVAGDLAVLVENIVASGLRLVGLADPSAPVSLGYLALPGEAWQVVLAGDHAYVADGLGGLRIVDVTDPRAPRSVGAYLGAEDVVDVVVLDSHAYLAASAQGLRVIDVSDPAAPREVGAVSFPDQAYGIAAAAGRAYVAGRQDVWVIDIADPGNPRVLASIGVEPFLYHLAVVANRLYVPTATGLSVLDVSDPTQPVDLGLVPFADGANDVAVAGNLAYVSTASGVHAVDLSRMQELARYLTPAFAEGLAVSDGLVYAAAYDAGLFALRLGAAPPTPTAPPASPTTPPPPATNTPGGPTPTPSGPVTAILLPIAHQP